MQKRFNEKTKQEKIMYITRWVLQVVVFAIFAYLIVLRIKTGEHIPMPLIGCILLVIIGVSRILSARKNHQGSEQDRKKFNKIFIRSAILAPIIVAVFVTVLVVLKME